MTLDAQKQTKTPYLPELIHQALAAETKNLRNYIGASSIGHPCERKLYYDANGVSVDIKPSLQLIFDVGKKLETLLLDLLAKTYLEVVDKDMFVSSPELPNFCGHLDAVLHDPINDKKWVLEIKTARASSYSKLEKYGAKSWNQSYYAQIQSYMGMSGIHQSILLVLNKDTQQMYAEEIFFDTNCYAELTTKARRINAMKTPPEKVNRSPLFFLCAMCQYKQICHNPAYAGSKTALPAEETLMPAVNF